MGSVAVGIFCKTPAAGFSKTRLSPPLRPEDCSAISACFISDLARTIHSLGGNVAPYAVYTPVGTEPALRALLPSSFHLLPQCGGEFGTRLSHAVCEPAAGRSCRRHPGECRQPHASRADPAGGGRRTADGGCHCSEPFLRRRLHLGRTVPAASGSLCRHSLEHAAGASPDDAARRGRSMFPSSISPAGMTSMISRLCRCCVPSSRASAFRSPRQA